MKTQVATVTNTNGFSFNVVVVANGDTYGLHDCLTHEGKDPLVEFYDTQHPHTEHGQFVSRYYLSSLLGEDGWSKPARGRGLNLYGGVPEWSLDASAVNAAMDAVEAHVAKPAKRGTWDESALGLSAEDLSEMDSEDIRTRLEDEVNRAVDLLEALASAFGPELGEASVTLTRAARTVKTAALTAAS